MHSYLIVGINASVVDKEVEKLSKKLKTQIVKFELSKIDHVRDLNKFTRLKTIRPTAITIKHVDKATKEALNAFLKNLEEPQENIYYILTARQEHNILPTILSRCQIVRVNTKKQTLDEAKAKEFLKMSIGEKLAHVSLIKKRDEGIDFVENLILVAHLFLHKASSKKVGKIASFIEYSQDTLSALKANGNVSLQLTKLVLAIA